METGLVGKVLGNLLPKNSVEAAYFMQHFFRYRDTLKRIGQTDVVGKTVLDVGALPGHLLLALGRLGAAQLIGLDYDPDRFGFRERLEDQGVRIYKCDAQTQKFSLPDGSVDLVLFTEVIEHFSGSPAPALNEIKRVLRPGGKLIITTPNISNLANRLRRLFGRPLDPDEAATGPKSQQRHHHEYRMQELKSLVTSAGFSIESSAYLPGTEEALLHRSFPTSLPWITGAVYALIPLIIPQLRSYLFLASIKK
jgi:SAM-dependent methyltransferase